MASGAGVHLAVSLVDAAVRACIAMKAPRRTVAATAAAIASAAIMAEQSRDGVPDGPVELSAAAKRRRKKKKRANASTNGAPTDDAISSLTTPLEAAVAPVAESSSTMVDTTFDRARPDRTALAGLGIVIAPTPTGTPQSIHAIPMAIPNLPPDVPNAPRSPSGGRDAKQQRTNARPPGDSSDASGGTLSKRKRRGGR